VIGYAVLAATNKSPNVLSQLGDADTVGSIPTVPTKGLASCDIARLRGVAAYNAVQTA